MKITATMTRDELIATLCAKIAERIPDSLNQGVAVKFKDDFMLLNSDEYHFDVQYEADTEE